MSRIRDIQILPLHFAPLEPYGSARGLAKARGGGLVLLDIEDGVQGIGEVWGPPGVARAYLELLKRDGTMCLIGAPAHPQPSASIGTFLTRRRQLAGSLIGGIR